MTFRALLRALRLVASPQAVDRDLDDELRVHVEMQTRRHIEEGMDPRAARAAAEQEFGSVSAARTAVRRVHNASPAPLLDTIGGDLRFALRSLSRHRVFSGVTVLVLTLGIAAVTIMFSIVSGVLLRPLPFDKPEQLVMVWGSYPQANGGSSEQPIHGRQVLAIRQNSRMFQFTSGFIPQRFNLGSGPSPERIDGVVVTSEFFQTMGVLPALGRGFQAAEEAPGADAVVVIGWSLWQRRFGGDPAVVGSKIILNAEPYTVVGIAPAGFSFPRGAEMPGNFQMPVSTEIWAPRAPLTTGPSETAMVARVKPGVTLAAAQGDLDRMTRLQQEQFPRGKGWFNTRAVPLRAQIVGDVQQMLFALLAAVAVLLTIACANAAQLLLARLQGRRKELAIRAALGASAPRLARVLLVEVLLLTGLAGAAGTGLGALGIAAVRHWGPGRMPRLGSIGFDGRVTLAAVAITLLAGLLFGLAPAIGATHVRLAEALRRGGRRSGNGGGAAPPTRRILITAEIALSVVLVVGSGLLIRSLAHELGGDVGFTAPHGLTFEVTLPALYYPEVQHQTYMEHAKGAAFFTDALKRIRAIPGVKAAAIGKPLPMSGTEEATVFMAEGEDSRIADAKVAPTIEYTLASPDMFLALGAVIRSGRDFTEADQETSAPVTILNATAARWLWPGENPIGKRLRLGGPATVAPWMTVVGVVKDMKRYSLTEVPLPEMFVPYTQNPYPTFSTMQFVVRSTSEASQLAGPIQRAIAQVDPSIPIANVRTIDELVADMSANARFATMVMGLFGGVALLLAMIGLYGVIAYSVNQRRQEFGVRTALGATRPRIMRLVLMEGLGLTAVGLIIGGGLALVAARLLRSMLYQVSVVDPLALGATMVLLVGATLLACVIPAARASGVNPRVALEDG